MLKKPLRAENGFTMVELLAVMVIIAILFGSGLKSYQGYIDRARLAKAKEDIMVMQGALDVYYAEHGRYPEAAYSELQAAGLPAGTGSGGDGAFVGPYWGSQPYKYKANYYGTSYVLYRSVQVGDVTKYVCGWGEWGKAGTLQVSDAEPATP